MKEFSSDHMPSIDFDLGVDEPVMNKQEQRVCGKLVFTEIFRNSGPALLTGVPGERFGNIPGGKPDGKPLDLDTDFAAVAFEKRIVVHGCGVTGKGRLAVEIRFAVFGEFPEIAAVRVGAHGFEF